MRLSEVNRVTTGVGGGGEFGEGEGGEEFSPIMNNPEAGPAEDYEAWVEQEKADTAARDGTSTTKKKKKVAKKKASPKKARKPKGETAPGSAAEASGDWDDWAEENWEANEWS